MTVSKTKVKSRVQRKTNPAVVEIMRAAVKEKGWFEIAKRLSGATRHFSSLNLGDIDKKAKDGVICVVVGKVLGQGNITKKIQVCALSFSSSASEKLKQAKIPTSTILEQIKKNPKAQGVQLL
jgi:large subunit ribosomal protein L18e